MTGRHAAQELSDINTGTGFRAYIEANRKHLGAGHDAYHEAGAILKEGILRYGKRWMMGMDVRVPAMRISKMVKHAGELQAESARSLEGAYRIYQETIGQKHKKEDRKAFDPTK